jgi:hypothetical protein
MSKLIPVGRSKNAIVDDEDYDVLSKYKWAHYKKKNSEGYAKRHIYANGKRTTMLMHRELILAKNGDIVDHVDMNGLNNTKANLRICNNGQNAHNSKIYSTNTSGYKGVTYNRDRKGERKYIVAYISYNDSLLYLGRYKTEQLAAVAYDEKAVELFGEFARTNKKLGLI